MKLPKNIVYARRVSYGELTYKLKMTYVATKQKAFGPTSFLALSTLDRIRLWNKLGSNPTR